MESGTAFPVNLSCEFFLWGLCSCMEESVLVGGKCPCRGRCTCPNGGIVLARKELCLPDGRNCACPNGIVLARRELCLSGKSRPTRLSLFNFRGVCEFSVRTFDPTQISLFYSRGVYKFSFRTFDPTLLLLFISRGVRNFSVHKFDPTLLPFFISRGVRNFSVHKFDPTLLPFFISRGAHSFSVHKFDPTRFPFFNSRGAPPHEKESFPFSWGQMLHFHKFPPDKNPRKHHAPPEKASAHRSRGF